MNNTPHNDLQQALRASKRGFVATGFFSLFINLLMLTAPIYMLQVYDRVVTSRSIDTLVYLTLIMLFLFAVMGGLEWLRSRILVVVSNQLDGYLSQRVYAAMFTIAVKAPAQRTAQPLSDLTTLRQFMSGNGPIALFDAPWMPLYIGLMFVFHPAFGWFAIAAAAILFAIACATELTTKQRLTEANGENVKAQSLATSNLRNAEVLHALGMLPNIMQRWYQQHRTFLQKQTEASKLGAGFSNLSKTLRLIFQSAILGLGAYYVTLNEMTPGMMIAGSILIGRALAPMDLLINTWSSFNGARASYRRLEEMLRIIPANDRRMSLPVPRGTVNVEQLFVVPPGNTRPALRGVNFTVPAGTQVGIVGPSAAGKSTLARALLAIWPASNGAVRIDGAKIEHYNADELGPHVGYLPQDIELFDGTVSENIARFGEVDAAAVIDAARKAGVHEMILQLPDAYDTRIGMDSGALSGGQRQRIGLARALYKSPRVIVLDEPNSNLDELGEQALAKTLATLKQEGSTVFIISHRTSILKHIDTLLVLNDGEVQFYGPRDDVMQKIAAHKAQQAQQAQLAHA